MSEVGDLRHPLNVEDPTRESAPRLLQGEFGQTEAPALEPMTQSCPLLFRALADNDQVDVAARTGVPVLSTSAQVNAQDSEARRDQSSRHRLGIHVSPTPVNAGCCGSLAQQLRMLPLEVLPNSESDVAEQFLFFFEKRRTLVRYG